MLPLPWMKKTWKLICSLKALLIHYLNKFNLNMKKTLFVLAIIFLLSGVAISSGSFGLSWQKIGKIFPKINTPVLENSLSFEKVKVVSEESVVIDAVKKVSPSAVTVGVVRSDSLDVSEIDPFDPFGVFRQPQNQQKAEQDIGSGFIISQDGMIVTNKHVVSDTDSKYKVITSDDKSYDVQKIYRDPSNDVAILKINASQLAPVEMGDSSKLEVGQMAIAIGTALGEFRQTVTKGVISGLGRGIDAGSPFAGFVERLDNVIQTDAAINPGNSGGPLLNSSGQVIGVNTAVATGSENIGFAIPINLVKEAISNFNSTGQFARPFLGVRYKMIGKDLAILNDVPQGAYIVEVVEDSPAKKAGIQMQDILTKFDGTQIEDNNGGLSSLIGKKKVGDSVKIDLWRAKETKTVTVKLEESSQ